MLKVSLISKWVTKDFIKSQGSAQAFIALYITDDLAIRKNIVNYSLQDFDYNWNLNNYKP